MMHSPISVPQVVVPSLYVHVPFCLRKCSYCDFYSLGGQTETASLMEDYVEAVLAEIHMWSSGRLGPALAPETIYFGGGTPTMLPAGQMRRLLDGVRRRVDLSRLREWTVECNPATADAGYLTMMRNCGVDRLSIGAQSFNESELKLLGRAHSAEDITHTVAAARAAGFARLSIDLIYAIPGQTAGSWLANLEAACAAGTGHISCYALTLEGDTPLRRLVESGALRACDEDAELAMLRQTRRFLSSRGYNAYEISNYARLGDECLHNLHCWQGGDYIGVGPAAASHIEGRRWRNVPDLDAWQTAIACGRLPATEYEELTPLQRAGELAMLQLRLAEGVNYERVARRTGIDVRSLWSGTVAQLVHNGLARASSAGFRLTDRGVEVADEIARIFLGSQ